MKLIRVKKADTDYNHINFVDLLLIPYKNDRTERGREMVRIKDQILYGNLDRDSIAYFRDALAKLSKELLSEKERIDSLVKFIDTKGYKLASENQ